MFVNCHNSYVKKKNIVKLFANLQLSLTLQCSKIWLKQRFSNEQKTQFKQYFVNVTIQIVCIIQQISANRKMWKIHVKKSVN